MLICFNTIFGLLVFPTWYNRFIEYLVFSSGGKYHIYKALKTITIIPKSKINISNLPSHIIFTVCYCVLYFT